MPLGFHFGLYNYCSNYMISITIEQRHYPQTSLTELAVVEPHCPWHEPPERPPGIVSQWLASVDCPIDGRHDGGARLPHPNSLWRGTRQRK